MYGLKALHCLTGQGGWEMRMDIRLANGTRITLLYKEFKVASAKDKYKLTIGDFYGATTDPMAVHNGMYFSTMNNDNDQSNNNCALLSGASGPNGGWWYNNCWEINPNNYYKYGIYLNGKWTRRQPTNTRMMIRPRNCKI